MKKRVIAFDVGGTNIRAAVVEDDKILRILKDKTPCEKKLIIKKIEGFIEELLDDSIKGVGIAFPSILENGLIKSPPNMAIKNFNLKKYLEKRYGIKVYTLNDASCVALAESRFGCKKRDFFILTLGTGIGGGIIIDSKLYSGCGYGSELGHVFVDNNFLEDLWKNTRKKIKKEFGEKLTIKEVLRINNKKSRGIINECAEYLGKGIVSLINVLDPEVVILAGGPVDSGKAFLDLIKKSVKKNSFLPKATSISWTRLKYPGILGASLLVN